MDLILNNWQTRLNPKLFKKDPISSELGLRISREGLLLFAEVGFDGFTFKKLAERLNTTESSIYRYFDNKHRLLIYLIAHHWLWLEHQIYYNIQAYASVEDQLNRALEILCHPEELAWPFEQLDRKALQKVLIDASLRAYYSDEVDLENKDGLFSDYKRLNQRLSKLLTQCAPDYPFPKALVSTIFETIHSQQFYAMHLPSLTDLDHQRGQVFQFVSTLINNCITCHKS